MECWSFLAQGLHQTTVLLYSIFHATDSTLWRISRWRKQENSRCLWVCMLMGFGIPRFRRDALITWLSPCPMTFDFCGRTNAIQKFCESFRKAWYLNTFTADWFQAKCDQGEFSHTSDAELALKIVFSECRLSICFQVKGTCWDFCARRITATAAVLGTVPSMVCLRSQLGC